jgi:capsular polysaccharide biosynthesis protein
VFFVAGLIGGLVLGAGLAVVAELLDRTLRRPAQFAAIAQAPVLTRVDLRARRPEASAD